MQTRLLPALLALLLSPFTPAAAAQSPHQPPAKEGAAETDAARKELERKALGLLEEALAAAQGLRLAENRLRAQVAAARLLWPRDPQAARAAFKNAADGLAALNANINPEDPQLYHVAQAAMQMRGELVHLAARHDARLALEFLRSSRPHYAEALAAAGYGHPTQEQMLETNLASQVAMQDPRQALEVAEESLNRAVTSGLVNVLNNLRSKDPAAASKLAAQIVRKLSTEDLLNNYEAGSVAHQLLLMTRPAENPPAGSAAPLIVASGRYAPAASPAPLLDAQTRRELVEKVLAAVSRGSLNQGGAYNLFQAFHALLPEIERYEPARAAALRRRAEELERRLDPHTQRMRPYQELLQTGTAEALVEAAAKAPAEVRDQLYMQAVWKTLNEAGDAERARQILEHVSNPQQRAQARRSIEQQTQRRATEKGNYAEARQLAAGLTTAEEKIMALLQIARHASAAGDRQTARQVLEDAGALVEGQARGQQQFNYRLQVAHVYAQFDAGAAFDLVESAVARLDELLDAAAVVDGFGQEAFREGELRPQGGYMWHDLISQCAQTLAALAPSDFERASAGAKKFRRPEARMTAQLVLAQHLLDRLTSTTEPTLRRRSPAIVFGVR